MDATLQTLITRLGQQNEPNSITPEYLANILQTFAQKVHFTAETIKRLSGEDAHSPLPVSADIVASIEEILMGHINNIFYDIETIQDEIQRLKNNTPSDSQTASASPLTLRLVFDDRVPHTMIGNDPAETPDYLITLTDAETQQQLIDEETGESCAVNPKAPYLGVPAGTDVSVYTLRYVRNNRTHNRKTNKKSWHRIRQIRKDDNGQYYEIEPVKLKLRTDTPEFTQDGYDFYEIVAQDYDTHHGLLRFLNLYETDFLNPTSENLPVGQFLYNYNSGVYLERNGIAESDIIQFRVTETKFSHANAIPLFIAINTAYPKINLINGSSAEQTSVTEQDIINVIDENYSFLTEQDVNNIVGLSVNQSSLKRFALPSANGNNTQNDFLEVSLNNKLTRISYPSAAVKYMMMKFLQPLTGNWYKCVLTGAIEETNNEQPFIEYAYIPRAQDGNGNITQYRSSQFIVETTGLEERLKRSISLEDVSATMNVRYQQGEETDCNARVRISNEGTGYNSAYLEAENETEAKYATIGVCDNYIVLRADNQEMMLDENALEQLQYLINSQLNLNDTSVSQLNCLTSLMINPFFISEQRTLRDGKYVKIEEDSPSGLVNTGIEHLTDFDNGIMANRFDRHNQWNLKFGPISIKLQVKHRYTKDSTITEEDIYNSEMTAAKIIVGIGQTTLEIDETKLNNLAQLLQ